MPDNSNTVVPKKIGKCKILRIKNKKKYYLCDIQLLSTEEIINNVILENDNVSKIYMLYEICNVYYIE